MTDTLCPDDELTVLVAEIAQDPDLAAGAMARLVEHYSADPRLHFLNGSISAGAGDYEAARTAMRKAVALAPDFDIARFQLGLLTLTMGEAYAAQECWGPLHALPEHHALRLFASGLAAMIADRFREAERLLREGMAANKENEPLNHDMGLIVVELSARLNDASVGAASSTEALLRAALFKTKH